MNFTKRFFCCLMAVSLLLCGVSGYADGFSVETAELTDAQKLLRGYDMTDKTYVYMEFGSYPFYADGTEKACLWRVLEVADDEAFLLNEWVLDLVQFHSVHKDAGRDYLDYDIYDWMNNTMLPRMFTEEEQKVIRFREDTGSLFFLDNHEFQKAEYGFRAILTDPELERKCAPTPYVKTLPNVYVNPKYGTTWYWSRSCRHTAAGGYEHILGYDGHISMAGYLRWGGVRPALRVECALLDNATGSGTYDDPYVFQVVAD